MSAAKLGRVLVKIEHIREKGPLNNIYLNNSPWQIIHSHIILTQRYSAIRSRLMPPKCNSRSFSVLQPIEPFSQASPTELAKSQHLILPKDKILNTGHRWDHLLYALLKETSQKLILLNCSDTKAQFLDLIKCSICFMYVNANWIYPQYKLQEILFAILFL